MGCKKEVTVRNANVLDISAIIFILHSWTLESPFKEYGHVTSATGVWVADMIKNQMFIVAEYDDKIIGTACISKNTYPWDDTTAILDVDFINVLKDYRRTGAGIKIMERLKEISRNTKTPMSLGIIHGIEVEKKDRFMTINGFVFTGGNYLYRGD